jgi:hypothetical protein
MSARRVFAVGAVAGLVLWPVLAFAILVAANVGAARRRAAYRDATEANRREYEAFQRRNPQVDPA